MNKLFSTLALAATFAGSASAYSTPGTLTPYDMQPTYSLEALYGIAADSSDPDMAGLRFGFSLYNNAEDSIRHQFGVYLAYMGGDVTNTYGTESVNTDAKIMPITFGYDLNVELGDNVMLDVGAKAGYAYANIDYELKESLTGTKYNDSVSDGGFTFGIGVAAKMIVSDSIQLKLGYEYSRSYFEVYGESANYGAHIITLGASVTF